MTGFDCVSLETKLNTGWQTTVACWILGTDFFLNGKACFNKIKFHIWAANAHPVIFPKTSHMQFYKLEGRRFESRMRWIFFNLPNPSSHTMALGPTQPLTEMSTRKFPRGKKAAGT
jgi:hypothetical protein